MAKSQEPEPVRKIRVETIELHISICGSYILLAKNSKDPQQAALFKSRAQAAYEEARSLLKLAPLPDRQESSFMKQLHSIEDGLRELDALLDGGK